MSYFQIFTRPQMTIDLHYKPQASQTRYIASTYKAYCKIHICLVLEISCSQADTHTYIYIPTHTPLRIKQLQFTSKQTGLLNQLMEMLGPYLKSQHFNINYRHDFYMMQMSNLNVFDNKADMNQTYHFASIPSFLFPLLDSLK